MFGLETFANHSQSQLVLKEKETKEEKRYPKWKYLPAMLVIENSIQLIITWGSEPKPLKGGPKTR